MVSSAFQELREMVAHSATVQSSAVELLKGLADKLNELADHPSADDIRALAQEIKGHAQELGAAIALHEGKNDDEEPEPPDEDEDEDDIERR